MAKGSARLSIPSLQIFYVSALDNQDVSCYSSLWKSLVQQNVIVITLRNSICQYGKWHKVTLMIEETCYLYRSKTIFVDFHSQPEKLIQVKYTKFTLVGKYTDIRVQFSLAIPLEIAHLRGPLKGTM